MAHASRPVRVRARLVALVLGATLTIPLGVAPAAASGSLFLPAVTIYLPSAADAVTIGDVTGDGRDDVVATTGYDFDPANDFRLWVLVQGPDGLLQEPVSYATAGTYSSRPQSVDIGDVNGDGLADVVVGLDRYGIQVFPGRADGTLGAPSLTLHGDSTRIRVGQLDKDGRADVAGIGWDSDTVTVFSDTGTGLAARATYAAIHNGYDDLETGDVTGDGLQDLVVMSGQGFGPNMSVVPGLANGTFGAATPYSIYDQQVNTHGIGVGDTNGDGRADIAASYGGNSPSSRVALWTQLADGTLDLPVIHGSYDIPEPVEVADLDLDGRADVVTLHGGWMQAGVYLGRASATLDIEQLYPIPYASHYNPHGLAIGDVNGDGWPDVVGADDNNGLVVLSNSQVFQPTEPDPPILNAANPGNGSVQLVWQPPENDGGSAIQSYTATASPGGQYCLTSSVVCTIGGLTNGVTYSFTVRATNGVGIGDPSNARTAMPGVAPSAPRSLATSPNLAAGVGLAWQAPTSPGDPALQGYRIYRGVSGGPLSLLASVDATATSFTDRAVVNGGSYSYQVSAYSAFGEGPRTTVATAQRGTAPSAPRSPTATVGPKGITLTWQAPATNGGAAVTAYRIYRSTASGTESFLVSVGASTLTYLDRAVTRKVRYFYWITAVNVLGEGAHSTEVSATAR